MDLTAMQEQVATLEAQLARLHEGQAELQRKLRALQVTVTSADGLAMATVDARGQVQRIELDPRIYQRPDSRRLAATLTATIQQAVAEATDQVLELTRPFVPEEILRAQLDLDFDAVREGQAALLER